MIKNFILNKLHNPDDYFKFYLEDISRVLQGRNDGGFEEPIKYYFSSKILEKYSQSHRIYTGNTPKGGLVESLLFPNNSKPDLVAISNSTNSVEIFEFKTIVLKPFLYSFMFSSDGSEKKFNSQDGDYWKQKNRKEQSIQNSISCNCYLLFFYIESNKKPSKIWVERFNSKVTSKDLTIIEDNLLYIWKDFQIRFLLLAVN
jgi:hypothetical protein